jgi:predicted AAA+ superfamily ATPase
MMLKETLREVAITQKSEILNSEYGISREKLDDIATNTELAVIISGIRRSGKSTLLRQLMGKQKDFHYINFEDVRIYGFEPSDFARLESVFEEESASRFYYFDEIQNVPNWEMYIRSLVDKKQSRVFITGSNASMLSKELGTKLTGRHLRYELFPFSYSEYLTYKNIKPGLQSFQRYFEEGGFPGYLQYGDPAILRELFSDIIMRDIIVRYGLRTEKVIKDLALFLVTNVGKEITYNSLKKLFDVGSTSTIISMISYLEDSYLFFTVPRFDYSLKSQIRNPKKIYAIDTGLIKANTASFSRDDGRLLENIVFLELKRKDNDVFYYNKQKECDFVVRDKQKEFSAIQVCADLTEENKSREINGLLEAMQYLKLTTGTILTLQQEDTFQVENKTITILPVWKWLMK